MQINNTKRIENCADGVVHWKNMLKRKIFYCISTKSVEELVVIVVVVVVATHSCWLPEWSLAFAFAFATASLAA